MIHQPDEIVAMMNEAGFVDVQVVGGYDGAHHRPPTSSWSTRVATPASATLTVNR